MSTEQKCGMEAARPGIRFNAQAGRYDTPWGWIKADFAANEVQVYGPGVNEWFDAERALTTAGLFASYADPGMAVALAIHGQYAAWKGARELVRPSPSLL